MKLISHRGNLDGSDPRFENQLKYLKVALEMGYDAEVDVWLVDKQWKSGHDLPQYNFDYDFMYNNLEKLWLHCKNIEAFYELTLMKKDFNIDLLQYFWHQKDDYALTSNGYIWTYPGKPLTKRSICVLPEVMIENHLKDQKRKDDFVLPECYGVCSDFIIGWK